MRGHRVERGAVLAAHVGAELDADAVVVVHDPAGVERGGHAVLPDPVVQRERVRAAVGDDEAAVDHRPPQVPVGEVHPQLEAGVGVGLADRGVERVVDRADAVVGRDHVERAPDRRQLRVVGRVVEVVAPVPPALPERGVEHLGARLLRERERAPLLELRGLRLALEREHGVDAAEVLADDGRERALRRDLVVHAHDRRPVAELERAPDRVRARRDRGERDRGEAALRRAAATSCSVARVITPSVPSEPTNSCVSSGPTAWRGTRDGLHQPARRRRDAQRQQQILDLPVTRGQHAGAARGDIPADRGPLDRRRVVRQHQPAGVQLGLEPAAVDARLGGDGHRDARRSRRSRRGRCRSITMPPWIGRQPPCVPEPPPHGTTGTRCCVGDAGRPRRPPPRSAGARRRRAGRSASRRPRRAAPASTCRRRTRPAAPARSRRRLPSARDERLLHVGQCRGRRASSSPELASKSWHNLTDTLA